MNAPAMAAALDAAKRLAVSYPDSSDYAPHARVGLHTCEAVVGNIGTAERFSYTAIGDGVNLCSRLEGLNKIYGTWIIASSATASAASGAGFLWRLLDQVAVVGRDEPLEILELMGYAAEATSEQLRIAEIYPRALQFYFSREFEKAAELFDSLRSIDPPSRAMLQRIQSLQMIPPDAGWDGVFKPMTK